MSRTRILSVLSTRVTEGGKVLAQLGDDRGATDTDNAEWFQPSGIISRPPKVQPGAAAAQVVCLEGGDRDVCLGAQDARGRELAGLIKDGEFCAFAAGELGISQASLLMKQDGSINLFTTDTNTRDGKSVYLRIATGTNDQGLPDGFSFVAPWGTIKFDSAGFRIAHKSGAAFELGGILGMPAPLDAISSYCKVTAGTLIGTCSAASFGVAAQQPVAQCIPTQTALSALQAQITALQAEIQAVSTLAELTATQLVAVTGTPGAPASPLLAVHATAAAVALAGVPAAQAAVTAGANAVAGGAAALAAAEILMPAVTSSS